MILKKQFEKARINEAIQAKQVKLIDREGKNQGVFSLERALSFAESQNLDLVQLNNDAEPVCKVLNYEKYHYAALKKAQNARRMQKAGDVKEIKLSLNIGDKDLQVKTKAAQNFIKDGKKVKVTLRFRGREVIHSDLGYKLFDRFTAALGDHVKQDSATRLEGNTLRMLLSSR